MFLMAEQPRRTMDNPEYSPPAHHFVMPTLQEVLQARAERLASERKQVFVVERSESDLVPDIVTTNFRATESGRTARGQLEEWVERACGAWMAGDREEECTTAWVAAWIDSEYGTTPSRGAIDAVWNRWVTIGFAIKMSHPTQFVAFTPAGRDKGRVVLKEEHARKSKQAVKAMSLGRR
jgi:hypothetical protein